MELRVKFKALSLKQPWAALLARGHKTIEVRRWSSGYRGRVLIHAARVDDERPEAWAHVSDELRPFAEQRGGIVGAGVLEGVKAYPSEKAFRDDQRHHLNEPSWFEPKLFGFSFSELVPVTFRPEPGYFRLFDVELDEREIQPLPGWSSASLQRAATEEPAVVRHCSPATAGAVSGLLVSVRSADEATMALAAGAALIDVKEPAQGPLGRAPDRVRAEVRAAVAGRVPLSAAFGELRCGLPDPAPDLEGLAFAKWGLAGCTARDWQGLLLEARAWVEARGDCRLVVTAYADWRRVNAPAPQDVCHFAAHKRAAALLLDTGHKDGSTLLDWLSGTAIAEMVEQCRSSGVRVALAGSLGVREIEALRGVRPDWFAVRSAVCVGGKRTGTIDAGRVRELVELVRGCE